MPQASGRLRLLTRRSPETHDSRLTTHDYPDIKGESLAGSFAIIQIRAREGEYRQGVDNSAPGSGLPGRSEGLSWLSPEPPGGRRLACDRPAMALPSLSLRCLLEGHEPLMRQKRDDVGRAMKPHVLIWE